MSDQEVGLEQGARGQLMSLASIVFNSDTTRRESKEMLEQQILKEIESQPDLKQGLIQALVKEAVLSLTQRNLSTRRKKALRIKKTLVKNEFVGGVDHTQSLIRSATVYVSTFLYPLSDNSLLGDATKQKLERECVIHKNQIDAQQKKLSWFRALSELLPDENTKLSEVVTEEDAGKMYHSL